MSVPEVCRSIIRVTMRVADDPSSPLALETRYMMLPVTSAVIVRGLMSRTLREASFVVSGMAERCVDCGNDPGESYTRLRTPLLLGQTGICRPETKTAIAIGYFVTGTLLCCQSWAISWWALNATCSRQASYSARTLTHASWTFGNSRTDIYTEPTTRVGIAVGRFRYTISASRRLAPTIESDRGLGNTTYIHSASRGKASKSGMPAIVLL
jgi:hypothetical protein